MQRLHVQPGSEFMALQELFGDWNGWLCSYAIDSSGATVDETGKSSNLSSPLDLELLKSLRSQADCIVTTGKTARLENYKASKFAPIAFLTRSANSLSEIPAFEKPGEFENIVFSDFEDSTLFLDAKASLEKKGYRKFLFEGGASSLNSLITQSKNVSLVTSISNSNAPTEIDPAKAIRGLIGGDFQAVVMKDLVSDANRILQWSITVSPGAQ